MSLDDTIQALEHYRASLRDLVRALQAHESRRALVALMQDLATRDLGRILGLGLPPNWQSQGGSGPARLESVLNDMQQAAQQAGEYVGRDGIPPALDFLVASIRLNVEGWLRRPPSASPPGSSERTTRSAKKWWRFWGHAGG